MDIFSGENLINLIKAGGLIGLFLIIFSESGLLVGFFLPGDSLLFTAGFLSSQGYFNLALLILISFAGAVIGDSVGYTFGRKVGPRIFNRTDSLLFKKENLVKAQNFYRKHGGKTIILARFTPIIRTFAPIVAGAGEMKYRDFIIYNVTGGLLWTLTMCLGGYFLGSVIPNVDKYMLPIIAVIIFISLLPTISEVIKSLRNKKAGPHPAKPVI
jgi:membrane-associated protein